MNVIVCQNELLSILKVFVFNCKASVIYGQNELLSTLKVIVSNCKTGIIDCQNELLSIAVNFKSIIVCYHKGCFLL